MKICLVRIFRPDGTRTLGVFLQHYSGDDSLEVYREVQKQAGNGDVGEPLTLPLEHLAQAARQDARVLNDVNRLLQEVVEKFNR